MSHIASTILNAIGHTPMVRLNRMPSPGRATVLCKLEFLNPSGSVKDRLAQAIVEDAEAQGLLKPGGTIVEASSGNTGIALAMTAAVRGYKLVLVMPEDVGPERRRLLNRLGAGLHLTPSLQGMPGAIAAARELVARNPGFFLARQFENRAIVQKHRDTTAQEVLEATHGGVNAFVAGVGTGGTITGVGEVLKEHDPSVQVIAVEPSSSPMLSRGRPGEHRIPGIGADFVPPLLNRSIIDRVISVSDEEAYHTADRLTREEGLLVGPSSGANVFAALEVARELPQGQVVVTMLADGGERYLGLPL